MLAFATTSCGGASQAGGSDEERAEKARFHYQLAYGNYFNENGSNGEAALQEVLTSIELNPSDPDARMLAGIIFMGRELYVDAIAQFNKAVELKPDFYAALNNLGATYLALERWDDAIGIFDKLVSNLRYTTPGHGHNNLGWAWLQKGDTAKARRHFTAAIQLSPTLCPPYNNLGMAYLQEGLLSKARKYLERGIERCPSYAEPHYHLGRTLTRLQRYDEARVHFETCVSLSGDSLLGERCQRHLIAHAPQGTPEIRR